MSLNLLQTPQAQEAPSLCSSGLSFISPGAVVDIHHHHCYQIAVALDEPFDCLVGDQLLVRTRGFIANQEVPHSCNAPASAVLIHVVEAGSRWGQALKKRLGGAPFLEIDRILPVEATGQVLPPDHAGRPVAELRQHVEAFLREIFPVESSPGHAPADPRIGVALQYIAERLGERLRLEDIAALVHLSPERTRHLFTEQTGMPFSQYVLWQRIREIVGAVAVGRLSTAAACIRYGFTDYPHFGRVFRRMFGVAPNGVLRDCRVIL